jgi:hypothetical protein
MNGRTAQRRINRRLALGVTCVLALATGACRDMGLRGNVPLAEAETRTFRYSVYAATEPGAEAELVAVGGATWMAAGTAESLPDRLFTPVPDAPQVHALTWDRPPYDRLYVRRDDGSWLPLARVR